MSLPNPTGKTMPTVKFKVREGHGWKDMTTDDYFKGKKVVVFALPGAFTPTCSSVHLPRYNELAPAFKAKGVDDIICLSVNDSFVMNEWKAHQKADHITMLPDGNGELSEKLGLLVDKSEICFGKRSWRYSMLVNDGVIEKVFLEEEKPGDPFDTSNAETMLEYLGSPVPKSVTVFTRPGCSFCVEAKDLLASKKMPFEELVLNRDYSIKSLVAVSGTTQVPQVFIQGERIGGADQLKSYLAKH